MRFQKKSYARKATMFDKPCVLNFSFTSPRTVSLIQPDIIRRKAYRMIIMIVTGK